MKRIALTSLALGAWMLQSCASTPRYAPQTTATPAAGATSTTAVALSNENAKFSYVVGLDVGESIGQVEFGLDKAALFQGIEDMLSKDSTKVRLTKEERQATMEKLIQHIQADRARKDSVAAAEGASKAKVFLETNKAQAGVITTASGLQYTIVKAGEGASPTANDEVTAHYVGSLLDGKVFDSSVERGEPATFPLAHVIPGWQEMLPLMKVGQKVKCWIPPELAYGAQGNQAIPGNSILVFEIELLGITPPAPAEVVVPIDAQSATPVVETAPVVEPVKTEEAKPAKGSKKK